MPKPLQLHIATPCHEDWAKMTLTGQGRHCAACQKTVVDFTGMSDTEIIRHMKQARSGVCGRLAPDQLHRSLVPMSPVQRNGAKGWPWLLAGLIFTADGSLPDRRSSIVGAIDVFRPATQKVDTVTEGDIMGLMAVQSVPDPEPMYSVVESPIDTSGVVLGEMSMIALDSVPGPPGDTMVLPEQVAVCAPADSLAADTPAYMGGISVTRTSAIDSVKQIVKDTLTALRILPKVPKQELKVYPNPISRGSAFHISWRSEPGAYKLSLFSAAGMLVQTRVVEVSSASQVDTWEMPGGLAAGVYIVQAVRAGQAGSFTQKIVVE